jgi:hypothetical protein
MPVDFRKLRLLIERSVSKLSLGFCFAPDSILTEHDLRCRLDQLISHSSRLRPWTAASNRPIPMYQVHHDLTWFDEDWKLRLRPDITIVERENLRIRGEDRMGGFDYFSGGGQICGRTTRLPSKQFEFDGRAITIELKFARNGITQAMAGLIRRDFQKMMRLFQILDERGDGESVFSYLVILNRFQQPPWQTPLAKFLKENQSGRRHKIIYKTWRSLSKRELRMVNMCPVHPISFLNVHD